MRSFMCLAIIVAGFFLAGCATQEVSHRSASQLIVPDTALVGRVVKVNTNGQFAVVNFPLARLPAWDKPLGVYRNGQKVGELKTTRWQLDDNIAADIVSGECQIGDDVSDR